MADGVLVTDRDGAVVLHNPPAGRLLGRSELPLMHRAVEDVAPEEVGSMVRALLNEVPTTARAAELHVEGVGDLRVHGSPLHLPDGEVLGVVAVIQDVTHFKDLDRMKSEFVAMVSHELRSPLAAIQQQMAVMAGGMAGEVTEKQRSLLDRAQARAQGLLDLIDDLLDLARIEAGRRVDRREPVEVEPLLERTVGLFRELADKKGLRLDREPFPHPLVVVGDGGSLEEVFTNLLSNAIAYTPAGGEIRVRGGSRGGYIWVEVRDTGVGIPAEAVPKIFDRFYRVKDEKTRHVVGTGLGLPIVKGIVEAHLGTVEVESEPGKGSTFRVLIPEAVAQPASLREADETGPAPHS
jgi:PAS domain S-box-containing protein